MTKHEIMAMCLNKGLKVKTINGDILDLVGVINNDVYVEHPEHGIVKYNSFDVLPIFHPLSDLTKPIEHNGEIFIPIVELAKIASARLKPAPADCNKFEVDTEFFKYGSRLWENFFWYDEKGFFCWVIATQRREHKQFVENQLQLFQKLIEWRFDIAELLDKEAIDVNILPVNPYK